MATGGKRMNEKYIERRLTAEVKKRGGLCPKFVSPGLVGVPDRLVLFKGGLLAFVELKAPYKKPRQIQVKRMEQLRQLGFKVYVIDNVEMIGGVLDEIQST